MGRVLKRASSIPPTTALLVGSPEARRRLGAMDVTKAYEFIGFGAMHVAKPYEFIGFGAMGQSP